MMMKIEKLTYSSRNGYHVELRQKGCLVLQPDEVYILFLLAKAQLSQAEMDEHFSDDEQKVIQRYERLIYENAAEVARKHQDFSVLKRIKKEVRQYLKAWMELIGEGANTIMEQIYGWQIRSLIEGTNMTEHMIRKGLKEGRTDKEYFRMLLKPSSWGEAGLELRQELEKRFGPFD